MERKEWAVGMWLAVLVLGSVVPAYSAKDSAAGDPKKETVDVGQVLSEANSLISQNQTDKAVEVLEKAAESAPKDVSVLRRLTEVYLASGQDDNARTNLLKILTSQDFADLGSWAGMQYYNLAEKKNESIDEAIKKLKQAGNDNKANRVLQGTIAEGYVRLRDWDNVAKVYEGLLKVYPGDGGLGVRLRDVYLIQKNYEPIIKALEPAVKADPKNRGSSDILAHAYVGAGREEEAVNLYKQKIADEGPGPGLLGRYAQALMGFNRLDEAIEQWKKAFAADPANFFFKQRIAEIYLTQGRLNEAKKEWTELLNLVPENQTAYRDMISSNLKAIEDSLAAGKKR